MKYWLVVFLLFTGAKGVWAVDDSLWVGAFSAEKHFNIENLDATTSAIGQWPHSTRWVSAFNRWVAKSDGKVSATFYSQHPREDIQVATGYFPLADWYGYTDWKRVVNSSHPHDVMFTSAKVRLNLDDIDDNNFSDEIHRIETVLHELGHALGLDHTTKTDDIMVEDNFICPFGFGVTIVNYNNCQPTTQSVNQIKVWYK